MNMFNINTRTPTLYPKLLFIVQIFLKPSPFPKKNPKVLDCDDFCFMRSLRFFLYHSIRGNLWRSSTKTSYRLRMKPTRNGSKPGKKKL